MLAGFAGRHVVDFGDLNIDIFLEVQDKRYSQILYLIDYVVLVEELDLQGNEPKPKKNPGSLTSTQSVSYTHLTLRRSYACRSRWSPYH